MTGPQRSRAVGAKPFLSIEETALLVGESRSTLYRSIQRGEFPLPVVRFGGRLRVPRRAVDRLLEGLPLEGPEAAPGQAVSDRDVAACSSCGASTPVPLSSRPTCSAARRSSFSSPSV